MKYSVLMSVYKNDNPEFLKTALESIYDNQTRKPDEIVVVFDGKLTDELYTVLNNFRKNKEKVVFYYPQETNQGLGEALRIGSEKCTGDYIFRMDSDDISVSERFEKQINYIENHPEIDVLGGTIGEFNNSLNEELRLRVCPSTHENIVRFAKKRNPMNHMTVCIKRSSLKKCGSYKTLILLEDYYLWLRMITEGFLFANLVDILVYARVGNGFIDRRGNKKQIKGWYFLQKYMKKNKMVSSWRVLANMGNILILTHCSKYIRGFVYKTILRK